MRVVADTNVVVSGMLWRGPSRSILDVARAGTINLFTSALLSELEEVLGRDKFAPRIRNVGLMARGLTLDYAALATLVRPKPIHPLVLADPDDDFVLACALAAQAEVVVSGDSHLRSLRSYKGVEILTAAECLSRISELSSSALEKEEQL